MSTQYDDSKFGVEKILLLPTELCTATGKAWGPANKSTGMITLSEDITVTELGIILSSPMTGSPGSGITMYLAKSGSNNPYATLQLATGVGYTAGETVKTTTINTAAGFSSGDIINFCIGVTTGSGAGYPYIKYKSRF